MSSALTITSFRIVKERSASRRRQKAAQAFSLRCFLATYRNWWSQPGSNRRPPACKAGALPAELWPLELVGLGGLEPPTSPLSGVCSSHLSYRPKAFLSLGSLQRSSNLCERFRRTVESYLKGGDPAAGSPTATLLRLHPNHQPQLGQLPPLRVSIPTSVAADFRGVTGGVYKARERIHRGVLIRDY